MRADENVQLGINFEDVLSTMYLKLGPKTKSAKLQVYFFAAFKIQIISKMSATIFVVNNVLSPK